MKTPLALLNLLYRKVRTCVAVLGVAFAIVLVFMQLGFLGAVEATATLLYERLDFDLVLASSEYREVNRPGNLPLARLHQVEALEGVEHAVPLYLGFHLWRSPDSGKRRLIMVLGFRPSDHAFQLPELGPLVPQLQLLDNVLIDRRSRPEFGRQEEFARKGARVTTEIGTHKVQVVGQFTLGGGFAADGMIIASDQTFARIFGGLPLDHANVGLIKLRPGASPENVAASLSRLLPVDVRVWTRSAIEAREQNYWLRNTSLGMIFVLGVFVALLVGAVFLYQVIASDIASHLAEYATLKAIGYGSGFLSRVILVQALILSVLSYVPGFLIALTLYAITRQHAGIPIGMTLARAALVLVLASMMCLFAGLFALNKVKAADPADLF
jgi:putative ABC transport system permease protein